MVKNENFVTSNGGKSWSDNWTNTVQSELQNVTDLADITVR